MRLPCLHRLGLGVSFPSATKFDQYTQLHQSTPTRIPWLVWSTLAGRFETISPTLTPQLVNPELSPYRALTPGPISGVA